MFDASWARGTPTVGESAPGWAALLVLSPQGMRDLVSVRLHVTLDGTLVAAFDAELLEQAGGAAPLPGGLRFTLPELQMHAGLWGFGADARDAVGHYAQAEATLRIRP
jgi:hypothetical protein